MSAETDEEIERFIMGTPTPSPEKPAEKSQLKTGFRTTEFWFSAIAGALPMVLHSVPATWQAVIAAGAGAVYTLARGLAKLGIGR
jgi:hypothetical protein